MKASSRRQKRLKRGLHQTRHGHGRRRRDGHEDEHEHGRGNGVNMTFL
jgi:hypothetical protein